MTKCIDCGAEPPTEGLRCKSCEIKRLKSELASADELAEHYRAEIVQVKAQFALAPDSGDDSLYNVRRLRMELAHIKEDNARLAALFEKARKE